jgi:hypothetical protein
MSDSKSRTTTGTAKPSARRGAEPPIEVGSSEWQPGRGPEPAPIAATVSVPGANDVPGATGKLIGTSTMPVASDIESQYDAMPPETPPSEPVGSERTARESAGTSQTSSNSGKRSTTWKTPRNAREWAAQLNHLATSVLNGTVDLEEAKVVSSISRSAAQLLTAEVQRARFLQIEPDLSLVFDENPEKSSETPNTPE